jgi:S-adenosyl methyltransferase
MANLTVPARFDPGVAHPARVYSVWIGGKDHYPADRRAAEEVARCRPQVAAGARANRAFLARAVRYLAGQCGIRQFLDIGPGLPSPGATHTVAQAIAPESKIVYIDNDRCKPGCAHVVHTPSGAARRVWCGDRFPVTGWPPGRRAARGLAEVAARGQVAWAGCGYAPGACR